MLNSISLFCIWKEEGTHDRINRRNLIAIDDYLGTHQLIKPVRKPWYATIISAVTSDISTTIMLTIGTSIIVMMLLDHYDATH